MNGRAIAASTSWVALLSAASLVAAGCFEIDQPEPDAGPVGSALNGRILIAGSTGQSANDAVEVGGRRTRSAVRRGLEGQPVKVSDLGPSETPSLSPERRALPTRAPLGQVKNLEWVRGHALVGFPLRRYDNNDKVQAALDEVMVRAADELHGIHARVSMCSGWLVCLVELAGDDGKLLDLEETERVTSALYRARGDLFTSISRNFIKRAFRVPNDEYYGYQWHYEFARLPTAWDITTGDPNLVIAVIDTGLKYQHPDLIGRTVPGFDMIGDTGYSGDGDGRDPDAEDPGDQALGNGQSSWHGTHVGGTVAANTDNGIGVAGVVWQGKLQPIRVLGTGTQGQDFDILSGVLWAVGDSQVQAGDDPNVYLAVNPTPAKVLNLSLGGPSDQQGTQIWQQVLDTITNTQKEAYGRPVFITAAGNSNETVANIVPGNIPGVITVGASRYDGRRAEYSNWGDAVDVMAPGGQTNIDQNNDGFSDGILSTFNTAYDYEQGTSMAAPHVTGIVGLLASINPELDQATALSLLRQTANPAGTCTEGCGAGHVDATALLLGAGGTVQDAALLAVDVTRLIYQPGVTALPVNIINLGNAQLDYTTAIVGPQASLFSISPTSGSVLPGGVLPAAVTLTRGTFGAGSANLQFIGQGAASEQLVRVDLGFNDDAVPVFGDLIAAQVSAFRITADGSALELAGDPVLAARDNNFEWRIEGLPPGVYYVFAVGDDNNDGIFDPQRESIGAWPVASAPEPIEVAEAQNIVGVEFSMSGGFRLDGVGGVGQPCANQLDCTFAGDADCIVDWTGGYCSRVCDDGFCGAGASCEELDCNGPCNLCLTTCVSESQCRGEEGYICDPFGTCTPNGF